MALYTKLARAKINELAAAFGLPPPRFIKGILEGTVNTYYRLGYADRNLFLKIDEVGQKARLEKELAIFRLLRRSGSKLGFAFPFPLQTAKRKAFLPLGGKFVLLFPQVHGHSVPVKKLTPSHLKEIGAALARMHRFARTPAALAPHRFHLPELERVHRQIRTKLRAKHPVADAQIRALLEWLSANEPLGAPRGLIHADLFPENILWEKGRLEGILDFEAAGRGAFLFDVGVTLHACCHDGKRFSLKTAKAFLSGYESIRPLSKAEGRQLDYYLRQSAMRFLLTRLRDFELKDGPVKAKPFKDYREYLRRFSEIGELVQRLLGNR